MSRELDFTAGDVPFRFGKGAVVSLPVTFTANGVALNVSTWTFDAALYKLDGTQQTTFTFTINVTQANVGIITITGTSGTTPPGNYRWEFWRETPNPTPLLAGAVRCVAMGGPLP
ncbi:MAG: hypothetical protein ACKV2O_14735 [Acidimicrobiales bacterium]